MQIHLELSTQMLIKMKLYNYDPSLMPDSREHRDFATLLYHFTGFVHRLSTWQFQCSQHCIPSFLQAHRLVAQEVHPQSPFCYLYALICIHNAYVVVRRRSYDVVRPCASAVVRHLTQFERPLWSVHTAYDYDDGCAVTYDAVRGRTTSDDHVRCRTTPYDVNG